MISPDEAVALRRQLQATIDHVGQQPGARILRKALALVEGFGVFIVVSNTPRAAAALQLWLEDVHAHDREDALTMDRVSPYPLDPSAPGVPAHERDALVALVFARLQPSEAGRALCIDASRAGEQDLESWRWLLMRLNERRNVIAAQLGGPLVLIVPPRLDADLPHVAPDLWSIRSAALDIRDLDAPRAELLLKAFDSPFQAEVDEARIQSDLARARAQAAAGLTIGRQAALPLLLRLAGAKRLHGAPDDADALIEEATTFARELAEPLALVACQLARSELWVTLGRLSEARALVEDAIAVLAEHGDDWALADAQGRLATVLAMRGELDEALRILQEEALPIYERLGDVRGRAVTLGQVADILQARGQLDEALRIRREEQLPVFERLGDVRGLLVARANLAITLARRGRVEDAHEVASLLAAALADARRLQLPEAARIETIMRQLLGPDA